VLMTRISGTIPSIVRLQHKPLSGELHIEHGIGFIRIRNPADIRASRLS